MRLGVNPQAAEATPGGCGKRIPQPTWVKRLTLFKSGWKGNPLVWKFQRVVMRRGSKRVET
jgi:hypothetical protein